MQLDVLAQKISDAYVKRNEDMNTSIAKIASEKNLNIEQTKRLVEECNKGCYLQKMAETGEQVFDIADYEKVKNLIKNPGVEKKASASFSKTNYDIFASLEKTADTEITLQHVVEAIERCKNEAGKHLTKYAQLCKKLEYELPTLSIQNEEDLQKLALTPSMEKIANELQNEINEVNKYHAMKEVLFEKRAGLMSSVAGGTLKIGGKAAGVAIKHPVNAVLIPISLASAGKTGANKAKGPEQQFMENKSGTIQKQAGVMGEAFSIAEKALPSAAVLGMIGISAAAARGIGGMVSRMMSNRQLDESFQTVMADNKDLQGIPNSRAYFDVIARHSPSLALDPMVAPQLIRQFDSFGGVDVNTVGKLREIENTGKPRDNGSASAFDIAGGLGNLTKMNAGFEKLHMDKSKEQRDMVAGQQKEKRDNEQHAFTLAGLAARKHIFPVQKQKRP